MRCAVLRDIAAFAHPRGGYAEAPGLDRAAVRQSEHAPLRERPGLDAGDRRRSTGRQLAAGLAELRLRAADRPGDRRDASSGSAPTGGRRRRAPSASSGRATSTSGRSCCSTGPASPRDERAAALRLIEVAERRGVDRARGVVHLRARRGAGAARPRRAAVGADRAAARLRQSRRPDGDDGKRCGTAALEAVGALDAFLDTPTPGLWRDWMSAGRRLRGRAGAGQPLYHIAGAIAELARQASAAGVGRLFEAAHVGERGGAAPGRAACAAPRRGSATSLALSRPIGRLPQVAHLQQLAERLVERRGEPRRRSTGTGAPAASDCR